VFDGQAPPAKERVHKERKQKYEENKRLAIAAHRATDKKQFATYARRAIRIAASMNEELKRLLRFLEIPFVIAAGEADAMAAALVRVGDCYAALSDDSDLIVFGCPRVLYKLNVDGSMKEYEEGRLADAYTIPQQLRTVEYLRIMSVLSGCDYFVGLHGVGLQRAALLVVQYPTVEELIDYLRDHAQQYRLPDGFEREMDAALALFKARDVPAGDWVLRGALSAAEREMFVQFVEDHPDLCRKWNLGTTSTYDFWDPPGVDHPPPTTAAAAAMTWAIEDQDPFVLEGETEVRRDADEWEAEEVERERAAVGKLPKATGKGRRAPPPKNPACKRISKTEDRGCASVRRFYHQKLRSYYNKFFVDDVVKEASQDALKAYSPAHHPAEEPDAQLLRAPVFNDWMAKGKRDHPSSLSLGAEVTHEEEMRVLSYRGKS
jgi:hypothetical protein